MHPRKSPTNLARLPLHVALVGRKMTVVRDQLFPQKPHGSRFRFSRTGVQPSPGSSTIELPSAFAESQKFNVADEMTCRQGTTCLCLCHYRASMWRVCVCVYIYLLSRRRATTTTTVGLFTTIFTINYYHITSFFVLSINTNTNNNTSSIQNSLERGRQAQQPKKRYHHNHPTEREVAVRRRA